MTIITIEEATARLCAQFNITTSQVNVVSDGVSALVWAEVDQPGCNGYWVKVAA